MQEIEFTSHKQYLFGCLLSCKEDSCKPKYTTNLFTLSRKKRFTNFQNPADTKASFRHRKDFLQSRLKDTLFQVCFERLFGPKKGAFKTALLRLKFDQKEAFKSCLRRLLRRLLYFMCWQRRLKVVKEEINAQLYKSIF